MKLFARFVVTIVLTTSAFAVSIGDEMITDEQKNAGRVCAPGAQYYDGCNTVECLPGNIQRRPERECFELDSNGQQVPIPEIEAPEDFWQKPESPKPTRACVLGASYFDGCNRVWCELNNTLVSTKMACFQLDSNGQVVPTPELEAPEDFWQDTEKPKPARKCVSGASYYDGCNTVRCLPSGNIFTTDIACYQPDSNGEQKPVPILEAPEDFWESN